MTHTINRYNLDKQKISNEILTVTSDGQITRLTFEDQIIELSVDELYHPLTALESLRKILETKYKSIIGCNGCRIDTSYKATGGYGTYKIIPGRQATEKLNIFESTDEVEKLCTVATHKAAYANWIDSLSKK